MNFELLKVATWLLMATGTGQEPEGEALKAVERVLSGAVSKVLSRYKDRGSSSRSTSAAPQGPKPRRHRPRPPSSDDDDFQETRPPVQIKPRNRK